MNQILQYLGPIGQFLSGLTQFIAVLLVPAIPFVVVGIRRVIRMATIEATSHCMNKMIADSMQREAAKHDPEDYFTIKITYESGDVIWAPMFKDAAILTGENIWMKVNDHTSDETELGLECIGIGHFGKHKHDDAVEVVHVKRGVVMHVETGRQYRKDETWEIPAGEMHSAIFQDCYCHIIHRPALPRASEHPVNLEAVSRVFPLR